MTAVGLLGGFFGSLVNSLILGTALVVAVEFVFRVAPRTSAATRYLCWWMVLLAVVGLPFLASPSKGEGGRPLDQILEPTSSTEGGPGRAAQSATAGPALGLPRVSLEIPVNLALGLAVAWLLGSAIAFLRLLRGCLAVHQLRATANPPDALLVKIFERARASLDTGRTVQIAVSDAVRAPTLLGLFRPVILIPSSLDRATWHDRLDWVAAHELAHLQRWDDWTLLGQRMLLCVAFFHPLALWMSRRLDLERELACDQIASASVGLSSSAYASGLLRISRHLVSARQLPALSLASRLAERVQALSLRPQISAPRVSSLAPLFVLLLGGAAALAASRPLLAVSVQSEGLATPGQMGDEVSELINGLTSADPRLRAAAAYRLGQLRAEPAIPAILPLVADLTELRREPGSMSQLWGRPEERADRTSVSEEAVKALVYIGKASLRPLQDELSRDERTPDSFARWAVGLLADFD